MKTGEETAYLFTETTQILSSYSISNSRGVALGGLLQQQTAAAVAAAAATASAALVLSAKAAKDKHKK